MYGRTATEKIDTKTIAFTHPTDRTTDQTINTHKHTPNYAGIGQIAKEKQL